MPLSLESCSRRSADRAGHQSGVDCLFFQRAVAVVVDTGGSASHAAIVAREYGIPAVMGTVDGTRKLRDGQWIQVDGSRGLVLKAIEIKRELSE